MEGSQARACLLLHGFTGGPYEVMPLAQALTAAGWDCRVPVLPGHDPCLNGLGNVRCEDWIQMVCREAEELERKYGGFDLVGFSMGGMLAVFLAARYPVRRLALLGAAAIYVSPGRLIRYWLEYRGSGRHNRQQQLLHNKAKQTPLSATLEFMKVVHLARPDLKRIRIPVLIVQGLRDQIVHPVSARYLSKRMPGETQVVYFPKSKHLLCLDSESEQVIGTVARFLLKI
ncbi:MAG: esterase/lipase [Paenibacillaceae bacterium]|nr:esterase/lipase [Paenibacillaceae bacterium]